MLTPTEQQQAHALAQAWVKAATTYQRKQESAKRLGDPVYPMLKRVREAEQELLDYLKEVG